MSRRLRIGGLVLLGVLGSARDSHTAEIKQTRSAAVDPPEPAPAPLREEEPPPAEVEPPPLEIEPAPSPLRGESPEERLAAQRAALSRKLRIYEGVGYGGVALTVGLVASGVTLGVLAQSRSDELSVQTVQRENGLPPLYDSTQRETYERLQSEGQSFRRATIACFVIAGATALGTGLLFWGGSRVESAQKKLAIVPALTGNQAALAVLGRW